MKKIIAAFLALITAVSLVSCGNIDENKDTDRSEASEEWTFNTEFGDVSLPDDVKNAFDKAMDGYDGAGYIPVAYLGSQIVSGFNYVFLCVSPSDESFTPLCTVTVYFGFQGEAEVVSISDIDIEPEKGSKTVFDPADFKTGRYNVSASSGAGLTGDAEAAFAEVSDKLGSIIYTPIALLGTQTVSGRNYAILCKAESIIAESKFALAVIYLNVSPDGETTVTSVRGFEL